MSEINWLFAWAKENKVSVPIDSSGGSNVPKLLDIYYSMTGKNGNSKIKSVTTSKKGRIDKKTLTDKEWKKFYDGLQEVFGYGEDDVVVSKNECHIVTVSTDNRHMLISAYGTYDKVKIKNIYEFYIDEDMFDITENWRG